MEPKRFLISTIGSYGDVHPPLGIALELKRRGHQVTMAAQDKYEPRIRDLGLGYTIIKPGEKEFGPEQNWIDKGMHPIKGPEWVFRQVAFPYIRENYFNLLEAARGADVLTGQILTTVIPVLAEKLGKPWANLILQPTLFFSRHDPPTVEQPIFNALMKLTTKGEIPFRIAYEIGKVITRPWTKSWRDLRREVGLPAAHNPIFEGQFSPYLNLALFSKVFSGPQPDWHPKTLITGFPFYDVEKNPELSPGLEQFLSSGPAPLVFTLGTAAVYKAGDFYRVAQNAARKLGSRAVLLVGPDERNRKGLVDDPNTYVTEYEPFSKIFPRASVIVHQGGVGTTAQALASGRPHIFFPFSHDQPDNAARSKRLGVSLTLHRKDFTEDTLASLVRQIQTGPDFERRAQEVAAEIRKENGISTAADALEGLAVAPRA